MEILSYRRGASRRDSDLDWLKREYDLRRARWAGDVKRRVNNKSEVVMDGEAEDQGTNRGRSSKNARGGYVFNFIPFESVRGMRMSFEAKLAEIERYIGRSPGNICLLTEKARLLAAHEMNEEALAVVVELIGDRRLPVDHAIWQLKAQILRALGRNGQALSTVNHVLRYMNEDDFRCLFLKGELLMEVARTDEGDRCFDRLLELEDDDPTIFILKSSVEIKRGNYDSAVSQVNNGIRWIEGCEQPYRYSETCVLFYIQRARLHMEICDYNSALADLRYVLNNLISNSAEGLSLYAITQTMLGNHDAAYRALQAMTSGELRSIRPSVVGAALWEKVYNDHDIAVREISALLNKWEYNPYVLKKIFRLLKPVLSEEQGRAFEEAIRICDGTREDRDKTRQLLVPLVESIRYGDLLADYYSARNIRNSLERIKSCYAKATTTVSTDDINRLTTEIIQLQEYDKAPAIFRSRTEMLHKLSEWMNALPLEDKSEDDGGRILLARESLQKIKIRL